jgi:tetratricopeptide (TPR) repeat protein
MFYHIHNASFWAAFAICVLTAVLPLFIGNKKVLLALAFGTAILLLLPGWRTAAMGALAVGVLWLYLFKWLRGYVLVAALGFVAVLVLLKPGSSGGRWFIVQRTADMIRDSPGGIGFGQFAVQYGERQANYFKRHGTNDKTALLADNVQFALNEYLQITVEGGIGIGVLFALFTFGLIFLGIRQYRKRGHVAGLAALTGFVALSVCSTSFYMLHHWWALLVYCCCALAISLPLWLPQHKMIWVCGTLFTLGITVMGVKTYKAIRDIDSLELASQLSAVGYRANADSIFKRVSARNVPDAVYLSVQAKHCLLYHDASNAIAYLQKAATYQSHSDIYQLLGSAYLQVGDTPKAIVQFEKVTYMVPKLFRPRKQLADIYAGLHNRDMERYWLESIVRMPIKIRNAASESIVREAKGRLGL